MTARNKKTFFILWILCIVGALSVLPTMQFLGAVASTASIWKPLFFGGIQAALFFGLICWLSFKIIPKTDLQPFHVKNPRKQIIAPALIAGTAVGLAIFVLDKALFQSSLSGMHLPRWVGLIASIYGGVNEEVLLRLFLFTLIYFLSGKIIKIRKENRSSILWGVNIFVALLFGAAHLPLAFKISSPSSLEIFRIFLLNGIGGVIFGWLYWSRGVWTAIAAHFVADLVIHVVLI